MPTKHEDRMLKALHSSRRKGPQRKGPPTLEQKVETLRGAARIAAFSHGLTEVTRGTAYSRFVYAFIHGAMLNSDLREACYKILMDDYHMTADEIAIDYIGG